MSRVVALSTLDRSTVGRRVLDFPGIPDDLHLTRVSSSPFYSQRLPLDLDLGRIEHKRAWADNKNTDGDVTVLDDVTCVYGWATRVIVRFMPSIPLIHRETPCTAYCEG